MSSPSPIYMCVFRQCCLHMHGCRIDKVSVVSSSRILSLKKTDSDSSSLHSHQLPVALAVRVEPFKSFPCPFRNIDRRGLLSVLYRKPHYWKFIDTVVWKSLSHHCPHGPLARTVLLPFSHDNPWAFHVGVVCRCLHLRLEIYSICTFTIMVFCMVTTKRSFYLGDWRELN